MFRLKYDPNKNSIFVYEGLMIENTNYFIAIYSNATYSQSVDGLTYVISTIDASTLTTAYILPLAQTVVEIVPLSL